MAFTAALVSMGSYHSDASYRICCLYVERLTHAETAEENNLKITAEENNLSGPANGVPSPRKDLCHLDASDSRVFATKIIRFVWNMPSISRDRKNERFAKLDLLWFIF